MHRNVVELRLAPDAVSAIRFGLSPGQELAHAVRVLQHPAYHPLQWGWLRRARRQVPARAFELLRRFSGAERRRPRSGIMRPGVAPAR